MRLIKHLDITTSELVPYIVKYSYYRGCLQTSWRYTFNLITATDNVHTIYTLYGNIVEFK